MESQLKPVPIDDSQRSPWPQSTQTLTTTAIDQSRVLRNTYWLLALSMLPTIAGAYTGMSINFAALFVSSPIMAPLLMFGAMFGMLFVVSALKDSAWGILAVFGFTFVSGLMLAPMLQYAAGLKNGGQLVALAGGMTAAVFFVMATSATDRRLKSVRDGRRLAARFLLAFPIEHGDGLDVRRVREHVGDACGA